MTWPPPPPARSPLRDLLGGTDPYDAAIRAARTFLQAFLAGLLTSGLLDISAVQAATVAGVTAVLTLLQGLVGRTS